MPSSLPKKPVKRAVQKSVAVPAPVIKIAETKPVKSRAPHGMAAGYLILIFLVIGCLAAAFLMSEKLKTAIMYAGSAGAQLAESEKQKADLAQQLANIKTLQELAAKQTAPATVPADMVWDTYSSPNVSIQYPDGYAIVKATSEFPALTIKSDKGRIEIFRMKDFPGGDRPFGFEDADVTQAQLDQYIPKEFRSAPALDPKGEPYSVWIYYAAGDEQTKAVLDQAVSTFKALK